jgi:ABC-type glycerol-3-phosphate transport system permease component
MRKIILRGLFTCALIFFAVFMLFPLLWGIRTSLAPALETRLIPSHLTLEHYASLLGRSEFFFYMRNSLLVSLSSILITVLFALLGGYALARMKFRGKGLGALLLVLPLLPPVAILVPLVSYFHKIHLYNTLFALVCANVVFNLPLTVWMLRNFILSHPVEIEEAARLDGCSRWACLFRITLPLLGPGLISVALFVFINSWNSYLYAFALTSSQSLRTLPQAILAFLGNWGTYWGGLCAAGMLVLLPPVVLFLAFQKWFIAGIFGQYLK